MNESKIAFAYTCDDVIFDGKVLYYKGSRISARTVRDCYQKYGLKVDVQCHCGAPIQTRSYIKKSPRKSVYFCLKPGHEHLTKTCGHVKSHCALAGSTNQNRPTSQAPPTCFKLLPERGQKKPANDDIAAAWQMNKIGEPSDNAVNLTYHIRAICQYYLDMLKTTEFDSKNRERILTHCELTTPHHASIQYRYLFQALHKKQASGHAIYYGAIEKLIHCYDGAIIVIRGYHDRQFMILLREKQLMKYHRFATVYAAIKNNKFEAYPWLFVYGCPEHSFNTQFIDVIQHGCIAFMRHPIEDNPSYTQEDSQNSIDAYIGRCFGKQFAIYSNDTTREVGHASAFHPVQSSAKVEKTMPNTNGGSEFLPYLTIPKSLHQDMHHTVVTTPLKNYNKRRLHEHLGCSIDSPAMGQSFDEICLAGLDAAYKSQKLPLKPAGPTYSCERHVGMLTSVKKFLQRFFCEHNA